jgi:membrane protein
MAWIRFVFDVLKRTINVWLEAQVFVHAAALAFFTVFSIAPVVIVAVSIVGLVLGESAAQGEIARQLESAIGAEAANGVQTIVSNSRISNSGLLPTLIGFGAIVFGATTVFAQMQRALNAIWSVAPRPSRSGLLNYIKTRLLSLTVVLAIGFVLLVSLMLSVGVRALVTFAQDWLFVPGAVLLGLDWVVSLVVVSLLFGAIFRVLPDVVLSWRDVMFGAGVTALLFIFGRSLIALYLSTTATASSYGAAGSLVLLLLWVNYSSLILLLGAAFTRALLEARGRSIVPRQTAVVIVHSPVLELGGQGEQEGGQAAVADEKVVAQAEQTEAGELAGEAVATAQAGDPLPAENERAQPQA